MLRETQIKISLTLQDFTVRPLVETFEQYTRWVGLLSNIFTTYFFPSYFRTKMLQEFLTLLVHATFPADIVPSCS
jgi:hypothetical protein